TNGLGGLTVDKKSSVIVRDDGTFLEVGLADPTQTNTGSINLEISAAASALISADTAVSVVQLSPTIKLAVNVNGAGGETRYARFFVGPVQMVPLAPVADAYVENGDQIDSNFGTSPTLEVQAPESGPSRETYLRFDLLPAAGIIASATLELVPITVSDPLYHALAFVPDNSWTETGITWNNK